MKRGQKKWSGDTNTLRQLKFCSILLVLYFVAIIIYILVKKDSKNENTKRYSNTTAKKTILVPLSINVAIYV